MKKIIMGGGGPFVAIFFLVLHSCLAAEEEARLIADKLKNYNPLERPVFEPEDVFDAMKNELSKYLKILFKK